MSKTAKLSIFILILISVASLGFAGYVLLEKEKLTGANIDLTKKLEKSESRVEENANKLEELKEELKKINEQKVQLEEKVAMSEKRVEELLEEVDEVADDEEEWEEQIEKLKEERDKLKAELDEALQRAAMAQAQQEETKESPKEAESSKYPVARIPADEEYWAAILKEKASLEIEFEELSGKLSKASIELVELKQKNSDLQLELETFVHDKENFEREIKYKEDLVDNLSLELARTKNDKEFVSGKIKQLDGENAGLRKQIKQLVAAKSALEKSIVRLTEDKTKVEKKLGQTEKLIQSKIDDIWAMKDSIDRTFEESKSNLSYKEVELPPIVVSSRKPIPVFDTGEAKPGFDGKVVTINEPNNFLILNIGEDSGLQVGDTLSVYRNTQYIARLEVIQVRKDISAADIKDQWAKIKVGDVVR